MRIIRQMFQVPSSDVLAAKELETSKVALLEAQSMAENYVSAVEVLLKRIKRLEQRKLGAMNENSN